MAAEDDKEFLRKLKETFKLEAEEHVTSITTGLIELEKSQPEKYSEITEVIFRAAHSLKGASRSVNFNVVESLCKSLEAVFSVMKKQELATSKNLLDLLHKSVDTINKLLNDGEDSVDKVQLNNLIHLLEDVSRKKIGSFEIPYESRNTERILDVKQQTDIQAKASNPTIQQETNVKTKLPLSSPQQEPIVEVKEGKKADTVRVSTKKLDTLLLQSEELISAKLLAEQRSKELKDINTSLKYWNKELVKIKSESKYIQKYLIDKKENFQIDKIKIQSSKMLEFLEWNQNYVKSIESRLSSLEQTTKHDNRLIAGMVDDLLYDIKKILMLPFSWLLDLFPKIVRDLSGEQNKDIELVIKGKEIEIDRRILEGLKDPLIHLIRNCIDHGIEIPNERKGKSKPQKAKISISVSQKDSSKIELVISDDGRGIDPSKVKQAALKLGVVLEEESERLSDEDIVSLIFKSGISTKEIITDISGRGLGLAIVRENIEKLGGHISVETKTDVGTMFVITLPLTLATFRGILFTVCANSYVIPSANVIKAAKIKKEEIKTVENKETILFEGKPISLVKLSELLTFSDENIINGSESINMNVLVINSGGRTISFLVDEVIAEQEVLVKSLGKQLSRVRNIAGVTVLGSGKIVPILNVSDLMQSAIIERVSASALLSDAKTKKQNVKKKSILIVEDSITSRTLIKNILESAGYNIKTAIDGVDGFTQLMNGDFDLVVSDVEMPKMNGFDLISKIRSEEKFKELPTILITSLASREDKEKGIDVGANAYIIKGSFDHSNLLDTVKRLI